MAYDFVLYDPDAQLLLGDGAWHGLRLRLDKAETTGTDTLTAIRDRINEQAQFLPQEGITLADGTSYLSGDRCLVVSVTQESVQEAAVWLLSLASQHSLGLATATDKEVLLVGDETTEFGTETATLELPAVSPGSIRGLLDEVKANQSEAEDADFVADMLIVTDLKATERYLQATYIPQSSKWMVEIRDGSVAKHYQVRIDDASSTGESVDSSGTNAVHELFQKFIARESGLMKQYDWQPLEIPEAAIDYRDENERHGL